MTQIVEFALDSARFVQGCCRCNAADFTMPRHTEKVVTSMLGHSIGYHQISLDIPLCRKCRYRSWLWFGVGVLAFAGMFLSTYRGEAGEGLVSLLGLICIICFVAGARTRPVKILSYDKNRHSIRLLLHSDSYTGRLVAENPGSVLPPPVLSAARKLLRFFLRPSVILALPAVLVFVFAALVPPTAPP